MSLALQFTHQPRMTAGTLLNLNYSYYSLPERAANDPEPPLPDFSAVDPSTEVLSADPHIAESNLLSGSHKTPSMYYYLKEFLIVFDSAILPVRSPQLDRMPNWLIQAAECELTLSELPVYTKTTYSYVPDTDYDPQAHNWYGNANETAWVNIYRTVAVETPELSLFLFGVKHDGTVEAIAKADDGTTAAVGRRIYDLTKVAKALQEHKYRYPAFHLGLVPSMASIEDLDQPDLLLHRLRDALIVNQLSLINVWRSVPSPGPLRIVTDRPVWSGSITFHALEYINPDFAAAKLKIDPTSGWISRRPQYDFPINEVTDVTVYQ